jgi:hypothetical protein
MLLPQVMQNFQERSSSVLQAGHRRIVRFWPQWGQYTTDRPAGSAPLQ